MQGKKVGGEKKFSGLLSLAFSCSISFITSQLFIYNTTLAFLTPSNDNWKSCGHPSSSDSKQRSNLAPLFAAACSNSCQRKCCVPEENYNCFKKGCWPSWNTRHFDVGISFQKINRSSHRKCLQSQEILMCPVPDILILQPFPLAGNYSDHPEPKIFEKMCGVMALTLLNYDLGQNYSDTLPNEGL